MRRNQEIEQMKPTTAISSMIVVVLFIFSGCISTDDTPATVTPTPTPTPLPTPILTPVYIAPTPTPTPAPVINGTNESIYDNRSAAWLYSHGYYGNGGGGSIRHNNPPAPIPETATFYHVVVGMLGLWLLCRRSS